MAKIQVFVNRCLRQILGARWYDRLRNEELWRSTSQEPIEQQIKRRKWRWLGHTLRKPADNVTRRGLRWTPQGKRKRERPKTTWRRSTEAEAKVAGLTWGQLEGGGGMANSAGRPMFRTKRQELTTNYIINFIYIASFSLTVLGTLQYHEKCFKTIKKSI